MPRQDGQHDTTQVTTGRKRCRLRHFSRASRNDAARKSRICFRCNCNCPRYTHGHALRQSTITLSKSQKVTSRIERVPVHELRPCPACQPTATNRSDGRPRRCQRRETPRKHNMRPTSMAKAGQSSLTRRWKNLSHDAERAQS